MAISMLKIRRPSGRLIFNMGIAIPGKTVFLIETAPSAMFDDTITTLGQCAVDISRLFSFVGPITHERRGMGNRCRSWVQIWAKFIIVVVVLCALSYHILPRIHPESIWCLYKQLVFNPSENYLLTRFLRSRIEQTWASENIAVL